MKKSRLFLGLILPLGLFGQSVVVVPNTENYGQNGIVYNNSMFFSKNSKLVKFDGGTVVTIPEPLYNNQPINGILSGSMVIYNNKLCYNYDYTVGGSPVNEWQNKEFLVTYDGVTQNAFLNPEVVYSSRGIYIGDNGNEYEPIVSNGKLFLKGAYYTGSRSNLYSFDGQNILKINNVDNQTDQATGEVKLGNWALDYNNELYFGYQDYNMTWPGIAKFNGTNIVRINSDNYKEYWGSIFNLNNKLYFKINFIDVSGGYGIGTYDPLTNTLSKTPTPSLAYSGPEKPLIFNSQAFITVGNIILSVFDGVTVNQIAKVGVNDKGVVGRRVLYGNNVYFPYENSNSNTLLGKYSGSGISLTPNLSTTDKGIGKNLVEFNGDLYFTYTISAVSPNTAPSYLAKYDGNAITVFPNPDNGEGVIDKKFVIYGDDLYFPYKNAAGTVVLAKYGNTVLNTKEEVKNKNTNISVYKDGKGFSVVSKIKEIAKVEIMDVSGKMISHEKVNNLKYSFELNTTGIFIIKVTLKDGEVFTQKIRN
ncbi:hypothetical protein [Chryseobacterium sp. 22458]|uniref:hypothetical protein n=1 Tax=Chryseobacterium sp. 22458 TaxID=3453921 RepID=UPI003F873069